MLKKISFLSIFFTLISFFSIDLKAFNIDFNFNEIREKVTIQTVISYKDLDPWQNNVIFLNNNLTGPSKIEMGVTVQDINYISISLIFNNRTKRKILYKEYFFQDDLSLESLIITPTTQEITFYPVLK